VPRPIAKDWKPEPEQVSALASKHSVTEARIWANVPEFVWYWAQLPKKRTDRGWSQAFANRIDQQAEKGTLYVARADEKQGTPRGETEAARKHRERVEADRAAQRARDEAEAKQRGLPLAGDVKSLLGGIGNG
jgi:phage protein D